MLVAGIDVGSVAAKAVVLEVETLKVVGSAILPTGWEVKTQGQSVLKKALAKAGGLSPHLVFATGYGRVSLEADKTITEITCHAKGAYHLFPHTGIVLDIGGQDSKVISLNKDGSIQDFAMNDKCAAGTGRFLEMLLQILNFSFAELNEAITQGIPVEITSQCAVFAETEIVSLLAKGANPCDVAAGVIRSIVNRVRALTSRVSLHDECTFTGGLAQSLGLAKLISEVLGHKVNVPAYPQTVGALGAALLAAEAVCS